MSYLWLIARVVIGLALLNWALYHGDHGTFHYADAPTILTFVRYVIAGLYGSEIAALQAHSAISELLSIATFVLGFVMVGSLLMSSAITFRASRDDSDIREAIQALKREGSKLNDQLLENYAVSVVEAMARLEQLQYGLIGLLRFLTTRGPAGFDDV